MKRTIPLRFLGPFMQLNSVRILLIASLFFSSCTQEESVNWQHLDLKDDGVFGISTDKAYNKLLKGRKSTPVIVAVMDNGLDTEHEDLKSVIWVNEKEIPGNGIDDDNNGYIDDMHGWNFEGSTKGRKKQFGNAILTCLVLRDQARFDHVKYADIPTVDRADYEIYQKNKANLAFQVTHAKSSLAQLQHAKIALDNMVKQIGKEKPTLKDFISYLPQNSQENYARSFLIATMKRKTFEEFYQEDVVERIESYQNEVDYAYNLEFKPPVMMGDSLDNGGKQISGNNNVAGYDGEHGTHVAGIIGADRNNGLGIQGVADNVHIMGVVRHTANGRQKENLEAKAIRYAVDNGAKVINMSFGDLNTWDRTGFDEAIKYAVAKDVLLIHASGNHGINLDSVPNFPSPYYLGGGKAATWITVGASDKDNDETLRGTFSNYGKTQVDVFAPGIRINSTVPGSKYKRQDGTSMAAPVVAGLAALIRSYYPALTAIQVKDIIMKSVIKADQLKERCVSGGVVNAYTALQLVEAYKNKQ